MRKILVGLAVLLAWICLYAQQVQNILVDGNEVAVGRRVARVITPTVEFAVDSVREGTAENGDPVHIVQGLFVSNLADYRYDVTVDVEIYANRRDSNRNSTLSAGNNFALRFERPEPGVRYPWVRAIPRVVHAPSAWRMSYSVSFECPEEGAN